MRALALLIVAAFAAVPALALVQSDSPAPVESTQAKGEAGNVDPDNRVRCRRVEVTGSLVKRGRVCRTVREWRESSSNNNDNARKMIEDSTSRQSGN